MAYPKYDDLSDGARGLAEPAATSDPTPGYLFFRETDSSVPLFELLCLGPVENLLCNIDLAALMNAVYQYHPEYAALHNLAEQVGTNDGLSQFLRMMGADAGPQYPAERLIALTAQAGTEFIAF